MSQTYCARKIFNILSRRSSVGKKNNKTHPDRLTKSVSVRIMRLLRQLVTQTLLGAWTCCCCCCCVIDVVIVIVVTLVAVLRILRFFWCQTPTLTIIKRPTTRNTVTETRTSSQLTNKMNLCRFDDAWDIGTTSPPSRATAAAATTTTTWCAWTRLPSKFFQLLKSFAWFRSRTFWCWSQSWSSGWFFFTSWCTNRCSALFIPESVKWHDRDSLGKVSTGVGSCLVWWIRMSFCLWIQTRIFNIEKIRISITERY